MHRDPEFSIVIPVKDGGNLIGEAIASVLHQTHGAFRLLVLENQSRDATVRIAESFEDPRLAVFPSAASLDVSENWRRILDLDLAPYLTILSHDDILYPGFLEDIARLIAEDPGASLYQTHFHLINEHGRVIRACREMPTQEAADSFLEARQAHRRDSYGTGYVMRSADFRRVGGFPAFPRLLYADDIVWYRLAKLSYIARSRNVLFAYRVHEASEAQAASLSEVHSASRLYLKALEHLGYFATAGHRAQARAFAQTTFNARHRRKLLHVLRAGDEASRRRYREELDWLVADPEGTKDIEVLGGFTSLLRALAMASLPRAVRAFLASVIDLTAKVTHSLRLRAGLPG